MSWLAAYLNDSVIALSDRQSQIMCRLKSMTISTKPLYSASASMNIVTKSIQGTGVARISIPIPVPHTIKQRCLILSLGQGYKLQFPINSEEEAATIADKFYAMNPELRFTVPDHHTA